MSVPINKTFQRTHRRADCICYPRCALAFPPLFFCGIVRLPFYPPLTNECSQDSSRSPLDAMRDARENRQHSVFSFGVLGHQVAATDRFFFFFMNTPRHRRKLGSLSMLPSACGEKNIKKADNRKQPR